MTERLKSIIRHEDGVVQIVEATFVFPVMFFVLFFLIYMGNVYYIKAQVEGVVETRAMEGAAYCADPILETMKEGKTLTLDNLETDPYRYLFGGMNAVEKKIGMAVQDDIDGKASPFFKNMKPVLTSSVENIATFNNYVVYSTFSVEVEYKIIFPIRFLGEDSPPILKIQSRAEVSVNDASEFIRNTDMVIDMLHGTKVGESISDAFSKINEFLSNFADK